MKTKVPFVIAAIIAGYAVNAQSTSSPVNQSLSPSKTATYDLGSSAKKWRNLFLASSVYLERASNTQRESPLFNGKRARGTFTSPALVANDDLLTSFLVSGYDGSGYQQSAAINFYVDNIPSNGIVPGRISFATGSNQGTLTERLRIGNTGNFNFNNNQLYIDQVLGNVGIGTTIPQYKLDVQGDAGFAGNVNVSGSTGLSVDNEIVAGSQYFNGIAIQGSSNVIAIQGISEGAITQNNGSIGVYGTSDHGVGVQGESLNVAGVTGQGPIGIVGTGSSTGGQFYSYSGDGIVAYVGNSSGTYAGTFYGDVYTSGVYLGSDEKLKQNIQEFENAISIINKLKPKNYEFKKDKKYANLNLPKGNHYGLIAQDLEQVLPNLVKQTNRVFNTEKPEFKPAKDGKPSFAAARQKETMDSINIKTVNYTELIPIMIKGMQEQQKQIEEQQKQISNLTALVQTLSKGNTATGFPFSAAYLKQNAPNPANTNTIIGYYIPNNSTNAQIMVTDMQGSLVKTFNVTKGEGQITIQNNDFITGSYNYTLIVNGNKIDTKQMIITR